VPDHCVPEAVVKQLQLNNRGPEVGSAVGTGTVVASGVATTPGTLTSGEGAPGRIGTEGRVSGGGPGGGAGACARATPASATRASAIARRAPGLDVDKVLIAKKFSSDDATASFPRTRPFERCGAPL
jgi:hypothetical protein